MFQDSMGFKEARKAFVFKTSAVEPEGGIEKKYTLKLTKRGSASIDGTRASKKVYKKLREEVDLLAGRGIKPALRIIQVGSNPASSTYVELKLKRAAEVGITATLEKYDEIG
jgi:hypothetical protein